MPARLDSDALQIAAATLPRAIEVNAIEDCTVEGSTARNRTPAASCPGSTDDGSSVTARPSSGNSTNVEASTTECSRQCRRPSRASCVDSRAP